MGQVSLGTEEDLKARKLKMVTDTLDALVEEAYEKAIKRGDAITNPVAWRSWKRGVYIDTAKREGRGYLRSHFDRIMGGSRIQAVKYCDFCETMLNIVWLELGDKKFCDLDCAEGKSSRVSYRDWKAKVKEAGGFKSPTTGEWVAVDQMVMFDPLSGDTTAL